MTEMKKLKEILEHGLRYLGLDCFEKMEVVQSHLSHDVSVHLGTTVNMLMDGDDGDVEGQLIKKLRDIEANIQQSDLVSSQIRTLEGKIKHLKEENEELKKYKTYYELAKGLK